ncbi:hypothetical protein [Winogradskyella forsetii]|uniref:hypothetical protein n=1 Tax=Winogradskyella forsetii TaxID=2686077 RepID=UPI0015B98CAC|nr:hypothetical protein [Winogradskyella forsetii]
MKKLIYSILFLAVTSLTFQSCKSDDDNNSIPNLSNQVSIDGTVYGLDGTGFLESYGLNTDGSFDWDVELDGTDVDIYFDLNTNSENGLVAGTYTYSPDRAEFTYVDSNILLSDGTNYSPQEGTVIIALSGDTTAITFNLTAVDGTVIQGEWSGTLTVIN